MNRNYFVANGLRLMAIAAWGLPLILAGCPNPAEFIGEKSEPEDARLRGNDFIISPDAGPVEGGTIVTIVGKGFAPGTSVQFGANTAYDVTIVNPQLITAAAPSGDEAGVVRVTVRVPTGSDAPRNYEPVRILTGEFMYYILPPDDGTDTDGDGLTDYAELLGWEVWVDQFGLTLGMDTFGNVTRYTCISDPAVSDTDGDGLRDKEEFLARCDARNPDSDGDDLSDYEEIVRFKTSATHTDSDHDSRGPEGNNPPNVALLDGQEMKTAGFLEPETPFFSEYVEGDGYDRALEIYNPTDTAIDLAAAGYEIAVRDLLAPALPIPLTGTLPARSTYVLADWMASDAIFSHADQTAGLYFDGTQAVELLRNGARIDVIGSERPSSGSGATDQRQAQATHIRQSYHEFVAVQTFTVGVTGRLTSIDLKLGASHRPDAYFAVLRNDQYIAFQGFEVPGPTGPEGTIVNFPLFEPPSVQAGETLTIQVVPIDSFDIAYAVGDPYPGGAAGDAADEDYYFVTYVEAVVPWGDDEHSTRDHVLRRKYGICMPDAGAADEFDPALGWNAFPPDAVGDLGKHEAACVPFRIVVGGTSPSLADTDGDNVSDWEELNHPSRSPLVADLPEVEIDVVDNIDVRLLIEYADSNGQSSEYSTSFSEGTSTTTGSSHANSINNAVAVGIEIEGQYGTDDTHIRVQGSFEYSHEWGDEWTTSSESTKESQSEFARAQATSRERQETVSKGEMAAGLSIRNTGAVPYKLSDMAIAVRQYVPDLLNRTAENTRASSLRTIGTLLPEVESITLASGESSPVLRFADEEVNPAFVREFLANPTGLILEPAAFAIENEQELNYAFITQTTQSRTALVSIDYSDPDQPYERYYVATNVDRNADGSLAGVPLRTVLEQVVGLPRKQLGDADIDGGYLVEPLGGDGSLALTRVRGLGPATVARSRWFVMGDAHGLFQDVNNDGLNDLGFDDIVLHAGDAIRLVLARDGDGDGLVNLEEAYHGTGDDAGQNDTDGDGLTDKAELDGRQIIVAGATRTVVSNPRVSDTDRDGLTDSQEVTGGTNPSSADTDGDTLSDGIDPHPTVPAIRLYVNAAVPVSGNGTKWSTAYRTLEAAFAEAGARNSNGNAADDVSEIWVARGTYLPTTTLFLVNYVGVYGGFSGAELSLSQRDADPFTNGTIISGNIGDPASPLDNLSQIVHTSGIFGNSSSIMDGFTISDAYGATNMFGAVFVGSNATLRNLLLLNNVNAGNIVVAGGGMIITTGAEPKLTNVSFVQNASAGRGGGVLVLGSPTMERCRFIGNTTSSTDTTSGGAGMYVRDTGRVTLADCLFEANQTSYDQDGGGVYIAAGAQVVLDRCDFRQNNPIRLGGSNTNCEGGAVYSLGTLVARNCTFSANSGFTGAAVKAELFNSRTYLFNCSFGRNVTGGQALPYGYAVEVGFEGYLYNCAFAENLSYRTHPEPAGYTSALHAQLGHAEGASPKIRNCLFPLNNPAATSLYLLGNGNVFVDPDAASFAPGSSLRLNAGGPATDAGFSFFDANPLTPGIQFLDAIDAGGKPRVRDGDGDEDAVIDIGAHESQ